MDNIMTTVQIRAPRPGRLMSAFTVFLVVMIAMATCALARPVPESFAELAARVTPAVVNISTVRPGDMGRGRLPFAPFDDFDGFFDWRLKPPPIQAQGSGFIIDPTGFIVTNAHVVDRAREIRVTLSDGREYPARLVGQDRLTDLAVLKINEPRALPYVSFGDSQSLRVGDWVLAVGNPFGLGGTVTAGIVSARGRQIGSGPFDDYIQIDAPINSGNSGGPSFNAAGEVIGVNTAIFSPNGGNVGLGFAVPSSIAAPIVAQLREHGYIERGWLGIAMSRVIDRKRPAGAAPRRGVLVDDVQPGSPAARAGIQPGDIIVAYRGQRITGPSQLAWAVAETRRGERVDITVERDGQELTRSVTIGARANQESRARSAPNPATPLRFAMTQRPGCLAIPLNLPDHVGARLSAMLGMVTCEVGRLP